MTLVHELLECLTKGFSFDNLINFWVVEVAVVETKLQVRRFQAGGIETDVE